MKLSLAVVVCGVCLAGCAGKQQWDIGSETYVLSLPRGAKVSVDGKEQGTTPISVRVPAGQPVAGGGEAPAQLTAELPGFASTTVALDRRSLPPEVVVVLAPDLPGEALQPPAWTDARAMQDTGARLVAADRCADALAYLERALQLDPRAPVALREGGRCQARTGNRQQASQMLGRYLMNHPEAKDAAQVRAEMDALDRGRTIDLGGGR